jgi:hypothetical protein
MSAGAVFKLIANDGKADRLIMATALLEQRIKEIRALRTQQGDVDTTPTLVDLERTHILYVNAHFKPFAAIGYESVVRLMSAKKRRQVVSRRVFHSATVHSVRRRVW